MDNGLKDRPEKSDQKKHLQKITRLNDEKLELENRYIPFSSKSDAQEKSIKNLNHDLRSPLGSDDGKIDPQLINDKDQIKVKARDLIMIRDSAQSILDLINGTLKVQDTPKSLKKMNIDRILTAVMLEIYRLYLPIAQNKGISLSLKTQIDTDVPLPPNFFTNLIEITGYLVANSIKFTPSNGSIDVVFTLDADEDSSILKMTVTDTGKGMSADQISAFNQGKPVARLMGTHGEQGFGIGLQHVIEMVAEDNGNIQVKSHEESGTEFSLTFPLHDRNLTRKSTFHYIGKNGADSLNDRQI